MSAAFQGKDSQVLLDSLFQLTLSVIDALPSDQTQAVQDSPLLDQVLLCLSPPSVPTLSLLIAMVNLMPALSPRVAQNSHFLLLAQSLPSPGHSLQHQLVACLLMTVLNNTPIANLSPLVITQQSYSSLAVQVIQEVGNLKTILQDDNLSETKLGVTSIKELSVWEQAALAQVQALAFLNQLLGTPEEEEEEAAEEGDQDMDEESLVSQQIAYNQQKEQKMQQSRQQGLNSKSPLETGLIQEVLSQT